MKRNLAIRLAVGTALTAAAVAWHANRMPDAKPVPPALMPSPNARDFYTAAGAKLVDESAVGFAIANKPIEPLKSFATATKTDAAWIPTGRVLTVAEKDRILTENSTALATIRQGFRYPYLAPLPTSFTTLLPYYSKDRSLAKLLSLEGQTRAEEGRYGEAINAYIDAIKIGTDLPHDAPLIGALVGYACQAIGRRYAGECVSHLSAPDALMAAHRMEKLDATTQSAAKTMEDEARGTEASLLTFFKDRDWRNSLVTMIQSDENPGLSPGYRLPLLFESPKDAYDSYAAYMNLSIAITRLPWPA